MRQDFNSRFGRGGVFLALAAAFFLAGCLSRPPLKTETFSFGMPPIAETNAAGGLVLGIKRLTVAAPFSGRELVYRTGEFNYERDPYAAFLDFPEKELAAPIQARLASDGHFKAVVTAGDGLRPDLLVDIDIRELYGDFRDKNQPKAVLRAEFRFWSAKDGIASEMGFQKDYSEVVPLKSPTAAALMKGWNDGLDDMIQRVVAEARGTQN